MGLTTVDEVLSLTRIRGIIDEAMTLRIAIRTCLSTQ